MPGDRRTTSSAIRVNRQERSRAHAVRSWLRLALPASVLLSAWIPLSAQQVDIPDIDVLIARNRFDLEYLNVGVSNLPNDLPLKASLRENMKEAVNLDFIGRLWRLQGKTGDSFRQFSASRTSLRECYRRLTGYITDTAWVLLETSAPGIVRSGDPVAEHYLKLGFRDLEGARILYRQGTRYPAEHPTMALRAYLDAVIRIRRARRYALLALIESRTPTSEKDRYRTVSLDDLREKDHPDERDDRTRYEILFDRLTNLVSRKILPRQIDSDSRGYMIHIDLFDIHEDNYANIIKNRESELDIMLRNLSIGDFHKQESLPRRNKLNRFDIPPSQSDPVNSVRDSNLESITPEKTPGPAPEKKPEQAPNPSTPGTTQPTP